MYKTIHLSDEEFIDILDALVTTSRYLTERMDRLDDELPIIRDIFRRSLIKVSDRYDTLVASISKSLGQPDPVTALSTGQDQESFLNIVERIAGAKEQGASSITVKLANDDVVCQIREAGYNITLNNTAKNLYRITWESETPFSVVQAKIVIAKDKGVKGIVIYSLDDDVASQLREAGYTITKRRDGKYSISWEK